MKKIIVLAAASLMSISSFAGTDSIRTNKTTCSSTIDDPTFEISLEGEFDNERDLDGRNTSSGSNREGYSRGKGGKIMFTYTVPLQGNRERLDCNRLYEMELERQELELQQLRMQVEQQREALIQQQEATKQRQQQVETQQPQSQPEVNPVDLFGSSNGETKGPSKISNFKGK